MSNLRTGVIVGGTGAQGAAIVRHLWSLNKYHLKVLTRNTLSKPAQSLKDLPHVELVQSSPSGHDEQSFLSAAKDADFAFINTDGFSIGEVAETYWGMRFYELARIAGVKHFIYSGLDNTQQGADYQEEYHVAHFSGKSRVVDFLKSQPASVESGKTYWSTIVSGPYIEMLHETLQPQINDDGSAIFRLPLESGAVPLIHLDDFAKYVEYMLDNPSKVVGKELKIATAHVSGKELAAAYTAVTGRPAQYESIPIEYWLKAAFGHYPRGIETPVGQATLRQSMTADVERFFFPLTFGQNFTRFWNLWKNSAGNTGVIRRDYGQLDSILPDRVKSVEEWMRKVHYTGERKALLKLADESRSTPSSVGAQQSAWG